MSFPCKLVLDNDWRLESWKDILKTGFRIKCGMTEKTALFLYSIANFRGIIPTLDIFLLLRYSMNNLYERSKMILAYKTLKPDAKGRITIGSLIGEKNISSFHAYIDKHSRIILEPYIEIPARELWLHNNLQALSSVKRGLRQSAKRQIKSLGSFSRYSQRS